MTKRSLARNLPLILLAGAGLCACVSPRDELVPYMSSEGVANAAYTATYNGSASAAGKAVVRPAAASQAETDTAGEEAPGELAS